MTPQGARAHPGLVGMVRIAVEGQHT